MIEHLYDARIQRSRQYEIQYFFSLELFSFMQLWSLCKLAKSGEVLQFRNINIPHISTSLLLHDTIALLHPDVDDKTRLFLSKFQVKIA